MEEMLQFINSIREVEKLRSAELKQYKNPNPTREDVGRYSNHVNTANKG